MGRAGIVENPGSWWKIFAFVYGAFIIGVAIVGIFLVLRAWIFGANL